jgi:hypothetical protein
VWRSQKGEKFQDTKEISQFLGHMVKDYVRHIWYTQALMRVRIPIVAMTKSKYKLFLNCMGVLTLTFLHGKRMSRNTSLCVSVACPDVQYFSMIKK